MNEQSEKVVQYIINQYPEVSKIAIQKIVYLCEIKSIEINKKRLTDANFKHWDYGMFSSEINNLYERPEMPKFLEGSAYAEGHPTVPVVTSDDIPADLLNAINIIKEQLKGLAKYNFKGKVLDSLINKAYKTLPFLKTNFGELINFESDINNPYISEVVIDAKTYEKIANPDAKPMNKEAAEMQDEFMEWFRKNG